MHALGDGQVYANIRRLCLCILDHCPEEDNEFRYIYMEIDTRADADEQKRRRAGNMAAYD